MSVNDAETTTELNELALTLVENTVSESAYWQVNKAIAKKVGLIAANVLADLISKRKYFRDRGELQGDGSFFNTAENMENDLCLGEHERRVAFKKLENAGLIQIVRQGLPSKNYFYLQDRAIVQVLETTKWSQNVTTSGHKTRPVHVTKRDGNKNKENKASSRAGFSETQEECEGIGSSLPFTPEAAVAPEMTATTFIDVLSNWLAGQGNLGDSLNGKNSLGPIADLVETCKVLGLPKEQVRPTRFRQALEQDLRFKKDHAWTDDLVERLEQAVARTYSPVPIIEAKAPRSRTIPPAPEDSLADDWDKDPYWTDVT